MIYSSVSSSGRSSGTVREIRPGSASEFSDVVGYDPESIGALRNTTLGYLKRRLSGSIIVGG